MFKVGDKVRRKADHVDEAMWPYEDRVLEVVATDEGTDSLRFYGCQDDVTWYHGFFDLVEPAKPEYSTITQHKVGPYLVTVVSKVSKDSIMEMYGRPKFPHGPMKVLQECEEDYRDPEMSHEDMLERLRDRLVKIEGVTQIDIVGVNDGCGVRISLEG